MNACPNCGNAKTSGPCRRCTEVQSNMEDGSFIPADLFGIEDVANVLSRSGTGSYSSEYAPGQGYPGETGRRVPPHVPFDYYEQ